MPNRTQLKAQFHRLLETSPNAMLMIDDTGRMEMVNQQVEQTFGYTRNELLGQKFEFLVPERFRDDREGLKDLISTGLQSRPNGSRRTVNAQKKDGREFQVEIGVNPIESEDGPLFLSAIVDLSHLREREEHIQTALREQDILIGEIHHRVKNNFQIVYSLLDFESDRISDPNAQEALRETRNRIRSMAILHQTLCDSRDYAGVDFALFVANLLPALIGSYNVDVDRISLRVDVEHVRLAVGAAVPCGLMVNELITNALRHAFTNRDRGEIRISLHRQQNGENLLTVSDDGIGLPDEAGSRNANCLGLKLVDLLAAQIDGTVSIHRANPTQYSVRFPG
jgi:PAS domain S-box-containing protein